MEISEIKAFCMREIVEIDQKKSILDIFYIILKDQGKSYTAARAARIRMNSKQLNLFNEGNDEINMLYMRKTLKRKS